MKGEKMIVALLLSIVILVVTGATLRIFASILSRGTVSSVLANVSARFCDSGEIHREVDNNPVHLAIAESHIGTVGVAYRFLVVAARALWIAAVIVSIILIVKRL